MMRRSDRSAHNNRSSGQALVEMALVLPILLMILFGIIDMGWLFFRWVSLHSAAREGLRIAAMNPQLTGGADAAPVIKDAIVNNGPGLLLTHDDIVLRFDDDAAARADHGGQPRVDLTVTLEHRFFGSLAWFGQETMTLRAAYRSAIATWPGNEAVNFTSDP